jgi:hypothetical protein
VDPVRAQGMTWSEPTIRKTSFVFWDASPCKPIDAFGRSQRKVQPPSSGQESKPNQEPAKIAQSLYLGD